MFLRDFVPPRPIGPMLRPYGYRARLNKQRRRINGHRRVDEDVAEEAAAVLSNKLEPPGLPTSQYRNSEDNFLINSKESEVTFIFQCAIYV